MNQTILKWPNGDTLSVEKEAFIVDCSWVEFYEQEEHDDPYRGSHYYFFEKGKYYSLGNESISEGKKYTDLCDLEIGVPQLLEDGTDIMSYFSIVKIGDGEDSIVDAVDNPGLNFWQNYYKGKRFVECKKSVLVVLAFDRSEPDNVYFLAAENVLEKYIAEVEEKLVEFRNILDKIKEDANV